jgi:FMN phosphatase YigB (HAD superfamily)
MSTGNTDLGFRTALAVSSANCVIFDFHRTLCSDVYFRPLGESALSRIQRLLFGSDQTLVNQWMSGHIKTPDIAGYLSPHLQIPAPDIAAALRQGCRDFVLHPAIWQFAQAARNAGKRTALVTINMDVFSEEVVSALGLHEVFEVIVNSADHRELDKSRLWPIAFESLATGMTYTNSLLIDDNIHAVRQFTSAGGNAYQYTDDASFLAWLQYRH